MNNFRNFWLGFLLVVFWMPVGAEGTSIEQLRHLQEEGEKAYYTADYLTALKKWQAGLDQAREINKKRYISQFIGYIGLAYQNLGQYQKALDYSQKALAIHREMGEQRREAATLINIGVVYAKLNQYQTALDYYKKALAIHRKIGDLSLEAAALTNIGVVYVKLNQYQMALDFYQKALDIHIKIYQKSLDINIKIAYFSRVGKNLTNIGLVYLILGQYQRALDYYQKALTIYSKINNKQGEANVLDNIALLYNELGKYQKALNYYQQAVTIYRQINNKQEEGNALDNSGFIYQMLGKYQTALNYFKQSLSIYYKIKYWKGFGSSLNSIGMLYYKLGKYQMALDYHQQALKISRQLNNKNGEANALYYISMIYDDLGQYKIALNYSQQSLTICRQIQDKHGEGNNLASIGYLYLNLGQYQTALDYFQQALTIYDKIKYWRGVGSSLNDIGMMYYNLGQYQTALDYCQQALKISRELNNKKGEGDALRNIGMVYDDLGKYQTSLKYAQQALTIHRKIKYQKGEAAALGNIGSVYLNLGQYQTALDYFQLALKIKRKTKMKRGEGADLNNIGNLYANLGQYQTALSYYKQALTINSEIKDKHGEGDNLGNIGNIYLILGQYQKALYYYQQSLQIWRGIKDRRGEGDNLANIGNVYYYLCKYQTALDYYQQSLIINHEIKNKLGEGANLTNIGIMYQNLGKYQKAIEYLQDGANILETLGSADHLWFAQSSLAFIKNKLNQPKLAIEHYKQSINNIEKLRNSITAKEHKISLMRDKLYVYDEFIALLQLIHQTQPQKGYNRKAIEIFERKQGRIFLEEMGQSGARLFAGLPEEILQGESDLENQLTKTRKNLVEERSKPAAGLKGEVVQNQQRIKNLEQDEQKLQIKLEDLQQTIKTKYPDYYALKYPKPVKLDTLQKQVLESDELMLVYGVMKNSTTLWVIGKNTFEMFNLPLSESKLTKKISDIRDWMGTDDKTRGFEVTDRKYGEIKVKLNQASHELYAQLIPEKVRNLLTKERTVYVIPTGPLYALPFETLVTEVSKDFKEARYLIENVPIAYLSSASLLKILRDAQKRRQNTAKYPLLAFANPIYEGTPKPSSTKRGIIDNLRHESYRNLKNGFAPLPETEDEAKEIANFLNAPNDSHALQLGEAASVPTVNKFNKQTRLDDYQYLLFSTHGILPGEVDRINQPALVLSYPNTWGYLKMADVFGLKLNAKLVALSACNTGNGENEKGEGVMGLTRAFMYAGTPAIAVTLWSVESLSAKTLNVGFFKELKNIQKPAAALRAIKLRMLRGEKGEKYKRPYYWAPFVMFGDAK